MMGRDHALSGALIGAGVATVATAAGEVSLPVALVLIAMTSGYALWPDIDHPSATAARAFGPLSAGLASLLNVAGEMIYRATASKYDKPPRDGHRTITHTLAFALASGAGAAAIAGVWPRWGTFAVLFVGLSLAFRGMAGGLVRKHGWLALSATAAALSFGAMLAEPGGLPPVLVGFSVMLGSFTHCLGDSCTLAGCPWLWPIPIRGRRWYPIGTPGFLRFRTGTEEIDGEDVLRVLMWLGLIALIPANIPGAYPWLGDRVVALWS